jgi:hypothetical protein
MLFFVCFTFQSKFSINISGQNFIQIYLSICAIYATYLSLLDITQIIFCKGTCSLGQSRCHKDGWWSKVIFLKLCIRYRRSSLFSCGKGSSFTYWIWGWIGVGSVLVVMTIRKDNRLQGIYPWLLMLQTGPY